MGRLTRWSVCAALLAAASLSAPAVGSEKEHERARELVERGEILPLQVLVQRALTARPGRLLQAELKMEHRSFVYEVEILDPRGQVWEMEYDAASGKLIEEELDD